jgi:NADH-quinone oxidoreductase subunit G
MAETPPVATAPTAAPTASAPPSAAGAAAAAGAPQKPKTVKLTIDGLAVEVPPGTNLIEAARKVGIEIPYYCYHPRLTIAANCRMCLVETSNAPKPVPGCQTPVAEGITVKTSTSRVKEVQRSVLEFILLNHPVDCSICDQAGECKLQDYYMRFDFKPSRLLGAKVLKNKRRVLGPLVVLDQERCILCTRCVRFMNEIAKEPQLSVFGRGNHEVIDTFPGQPLTSNYAGNTVDICPVGALLNRDNRFKVRSFFLSTTPSVCTGCSRGCSVFLDYFNGETYRYRPRENPKVNDVWMCDVGRLSYKYLGAERALEVRIGRASPEGGTAAGATREAAVRVAAENLKKHAGTDALAFVASPLCSIEDLLAAFQVARDGLQLKRVFVSGRPSGPGDHFLMREDRNPNRKGLEWVARAFGFEVKTFDELTRALDADSVKALWAVGGEVPTDSGVAASLYADVETVVVQAFNQSPLSAMATVLLPASPHAESHGTFVNFDGIAQRFVAAYPPKGASRPHWEWALALWAELGTRLSVASAREVFRELSPAVPELKGFAWDEVPRFLKHPRGIWAMPAAADGRPVGYRERST